MSAEPLEKWRAASPDFARYFDALPYAGNLRTDWSGDPAARQRVQQWLEAEGIPKKYFPNGAAPAGAPGAPPAAPAYPTPAPQPPKDAAEMAAAPLSRWLGESPGFAAWFNALPYAQMLRGDWDAAGRGDATARTKVQQWLESESVVGRFFAAGSQPGLPEPSAPPRF